MHGGRTRNTRDASRTHAQHTIESFKTRRQEGDGGGSQTGAGAATEARQRGTTHCAQCDSDRGDALCSHR
eukprot:6393948-Prymnesium_polylepis.1